MSKPKIKYIDPDELSSARMAGGNEKKYTKIIDWAPVVKEWVGIGWIEVGPAEAEDIRKYPVVRRTWK